MGPGKPTECRLLRNRVRQCLAEGQHHQITRLPRNSSCQKDGCGFSCAETKLGQPEEWYLTRGSLHQKDREAHDLGEKTQRLKTQEQGYTHHTNIPAHPTPSGICGGGQNGHPMSSLCCRTLRHTVQYPIETAVAYSKRTRGDAYMS